MIVRRDPAGNTIGTFRGTNPVLPPIAIGSHTDPVPEGGRFDGALGIVAALACIRSLRDAGKQLEHTIEVINFAAEEATVAGGTFGSRAMAGALDLTSSFKTIWSGRPLSEHLHIAGLDPATIAMAARPKGALECYLELHCEQGAVLVGSGVVIGIVDAIVGIRRYLISFQGRSNHAGTTPMHDRADALVIAAPFIVFVRDRAVANEAIATVGAITVEPGTPSVIPGHVAMTVEVRSRSDEILERIEDELLQEANRLHASFRKTSAKPPVASSHTVMSAVMRACDRVDISYMTITSGAGHDAGPIAAIAPTGMVFVPSQNGISHSPEEMTDPAWCIAGASVLLESLVELDRLPKP